ncbi:MAG: cell surface protein SprA, partial [Bacteroidales bacterium]|nr:cell surface protein SprA [Bacteroidales bacterium]
TVFIRLGSDYQNNYYEYEVPLKISQANIHNPESVWPDENFIDLPFELLTSIKNRRNSQAGGINYTRAYYEYDPAREKNKVSIMGNPSLSEVKTIMIGIRNNGTTLKSVEVWVNELRLKGFANQGGWAAMTNATLAVSDLGTVTFAGRYESVGFGGIEQRVAERRLEDYKLMNLAMSLDLGKLYPKPGILNFPVYYAISRQSHTPKYDPLNQDLLLDDVLNTANTKAEKDSILDYSSKIMNVRNLNVSNLRLNIKSKTPLPIDPANFSASGSYSETYKHDASTEYEITRNINAGFNYGYSSPLKAWEPFAKSEKLKSPWLRMIKEFNLTWIPNSITFGSRLSRYYYELQNRDLTSLNLLNNIPLNFSKNFLWNTDFNLTWNFTKNMKFNFTTNNSSRIQETMNAPVNKMLYPDEYENWKDTVRQSIRTLGSPLNYQQSIRYTWSIPFNRIPVLDFITANAQYTATYKWDKSAEIKDLEMGNIISNIRNISFNPSFNFETLYNKSDFLSEVNQKYASSGRNTTSSTGRLSSNQRTAPQKEAGKFEKELSLLPGKEIEVKHNLKNKRLIIRAVDADGKEVALRYKVQDENVLSVRSRDSMQIKLLIVQKPSLDDKDWYKALQLGSRLLMSVRNLQITYDQTDGLTIPGFRPETGLIFKDQQFGRAPGWDFASGFYSNDYLQQSLARNWLVMSDSVVSPAIYTENKTLRIKSSVLPIQGLRIELNAQRSSNSNKQVQYMIDGMPRTQTGSFSMSGIALLSSFSGSSAKDGYYSRHFERFVQNRSVVAARLQKRLEGLSYPNEGFLAGTELAGKPYDEQYGSVDLNSADVLIPAFMAAYTGRSAHKGSLDIFPSIKALLPNWSISYDGLSKIPFLAKHFRSITLNHAYNCAYNVTSYSSYNNFVGAGEQDFGFVRDVLTGNPLPSSMYDISSISLTESFSPLINIQTTLKNGMSVKTELRTSRSLNLSISGGQLVEAGQVQYVLGGSYKVADFHPWGILENSKVKNDMRFNADFSFKNASALIRKIEENYSQATSGNKTVSLDLQADYVISRNLNLKFYYSLESSIPLVSSYPVTTQDFGLSFRFSLTR